jgi:hypothetical protein
MEDLLVGADGTPLVDTKSCDPFKTNLKNAIAEPSLFTPTKAAAMFFNFMIIIALAVGTWLGLYFVVNKDYDYGFRDFAGDTGKVLGKLALQTSGRVSDSAYAAAPGGCGIRTVAVVVNGIGVHGSEEVASRLQFPRLPRLPRLSRTRDAGCDR